MTDRIPLDHLTSNALDALYDELTDLRQRVDQVEELLSIAHETSNRSEAERTRAEATIARVRELRDDLREITGARWIADMLDTILNQSPSAEAIQATQPREHCGDLKPPLSGESERTECVLRPGHAGSHADQHDTRWWRIDQEHQP